MCTYPSHSGIPLPSNIKSNDKSSFISFFPVLIRTHPPVFILQKKYKKITVTNLIAKVINKKQ